MSRFSDLAAQKWPRIVISLFAITRLLLDSAIYAIGYDRANPGVSDEYSTIPADEQKRIAQGLILSMAALTTTFNLIAFYSAIRSSIGATKVSLAIWGFQFSSMFMVVWLIMGPVFTSEVARKAIGKLLFESQGVSFLLVRSLLWQILYGWSLVVHLRDLRGQPRNAWGRLTSHDDKKAVIFPSAVQGPISL
ncbi:hypothetical protein BGX31_007940 [Mortierella sp. GBA43]|nr:hypothetical protein BGX31_007940 [Mortierella sp. GBA43]